MTDLPTVSNQIRDPEAEVVYDVRAYRKLERAELVHAVRYYLTQNKKKPKRGSVVTIYSLIGLSE